MSVSLAEVVEIDGQVHYKTNREDAEWLLSQRDNFDEMCEDAEALLDHLDEEEYE